MFKKQVAYQLENGDVIVISDNGIKVHRKGKLYIEFNEEQTDRILEEYGEINR